MPGIRITCHLLILSLTIFRVSQCSPWTPPEACRLKLRTVVEDYKYFKDGDVIIGGIFTVNCVMEDFNITDFELLMFCDGPLTSTYRYVLDFLFAIEEINNDPEILPNVTLGYHFYDSCSSGNKAIKSVLQIFSGPQITIPNFSCYEDGQIAGFIGDMFSVTTIPIAQILSIYGYSQISYGATDTLLSDRALFPYLLRTSHNDGIYFHAVTKLLKHFSWSWVGIVTSEDDSGNKESQMLSSILQQEGVCIEFIVKVILLNHFDMEKKIRYTINDKNREIISNSTASVIIVCGTFSFFISRVLELPDDVIDTKTFILPPSWFSNNEILHHSFVVFNCCLGFLFTMDTGGRSNTSRPQPGNPYHTGAMRKFLEGINKHNNPQDMLLEDIWMLRFKCSTPNKYKNELYQTLYDIKLHPCSGWEDFTAIPYVLLNLDSPSVYNALKTLAQALQAMHAYRRPDREKVLRLPKYRYKLDKYLRRVEYNDGMEKRSFYNEDGEMSTIYSIYNLVTLPNDLNTYKYVGSYTPWGPPDEQLFINLTSITWKNDSQQVPRSQCSETCPPGKRKIKNDMLQICCYDCVQCSEGEISNLTDSQNCIKCLPTEYANEKRDGCVVRQEEYLSYSDSLSVVLLCASVLLTMTSILILILFMLYRDTPIIKANNKNLSFILLVSLSLCFLCVFLFIGRPADNTCMFRQIVFGITFSVSVSSVLAKTIMVFIAFKASRPGSFWRKLIGVKLSNSIVLLASFVEVVISIVWLTLSPPYQDMNTQTYQKKIVIECNVGSPVPFYTVLGYLGFLAAVSFAVAYIARELPDQFNEARYITFSMLVFCSVWITMIPTYLSTKGKNMVAVEIFSILTSSAGLLCCIFFPKCYIILVKPQMNRKTHIYV